MRLKILLLLLMVLTIGYVWIEETPGIESIKTNTQYYYQIAEIPNKDNYAKLVAQERDNNATFLWNEAKCAKVFYPANFFKNKELDSIKTRDILRLLNDTSSYVWGESTPEYDFVIVYFDEKGNKIGFTEYDVKGYFNNYPFRSLMKWGSVNKEVSTKIGKIVQE